jgi:hypothetical protein
LERAIRAEARRRGLSVNRTVLGLLAGAAGLVTAPEPTAPTGPFTDLDHLAGTWSAEEAEEFDRAVRVVRVIDRDLWS